MTSIYLELTAWPVLEITGPDNIYEGDQLFISCRINVSLSNTDKVKVSLNQGTNLLSEGSTQVNHSLVVLAKGQAEIVCTLRVGCMERSDPKTISVAGELTLTS